MKADMVNLSGFRRVGLGAHTPCGVHDRGVKVVLPVPWPLASYAPRWLVLQDEDNEEDDKEDSDSRSTAVQVIEVMRER
jgi:hypothetical protein